MIKLNKEVYLDKLRACWIGKNVGGTLGAPFEGWRKFLAVTGFSTPSGEPLPNDDLDIQLVWLCALEKAGVKNFDANVLAEFWLDWIAPHWNEYGIAKTNLSLGLLPPMSGEVDNEKWKTSNGAWIRSEIWAAIAPGVVDVAIKYAVMDAMVDHGIAEGTIAEIFTCAMQSLAYIESDVRVLIESALNKIPTQSMVAKTVRKVMELYDKGVDYEQTRAEIVELNKELGWFQAPINLGFVIIGLLYGNGDYKKSVLYAVNCGDDTDCTAGTVASTLGIIGGTAAIPDDWKAFVGDKILTVSINGNYQYEYPRTCTALTERVAKILPEVMRENHVEFELTDGENEIDFESVKNYNRLTSADVIYKNPYTFEYNFFRPLKIEVSLDGSPKLSEKDNGNLERKITFTFKNVSQQPFKLFFKVILPDGWTCDTYQKTMTLGYPQYIHGLYGVKSAEFKVNANGNVADVNRVCLQVTSSAIPYPIVVPVTFLG
ncbi:MAG: ADP-ribosylglycohydrolase family protein [Clostridia bacterium]|nr:ADP-ribosylglycohydrolase family protein [Clostridia bacterium]